MSDTEKKTEDIHRQKYFDIFKNINNIIEPVFNNDIFMEILIGETKYVELDSLKKNNLKIELQYRDLIPYSSREREGIEVYDKYIELYMLRQTYIAAIEHKFSKEYTIYGEHSEFLAFYYLFKFLLTKKIIFKNMLYIILSTNNFASKRKKRDNALYANVKIFDINVNMEYHSHGIHKNIVHDKTTDFIFYEIDGSFSAYNYQWCSILLIQILNSIFDDNSQTKSYIIKLPVRVFASFFVLDFIHVLHSSFEKIILFRPKCQIMLFYIICIKKINTYNKIIINSKKHQYVYRLSDEKYDYSIYKKFISSVLTDGIKLSTMESSIYNLEVNNKRAFDLVNSKIKIYAEMVNYKVNQKMSALLT
jgi:hypothetical protein